MLKYENNLLKLKSKHITSSDSIIKLESDVDAAILGVLVLSDGSKKAIQFVKADDCYIARLIITEDDIHLLGASKFYIELINAEFQKSSNIVSIKFDIDSIKLDIKKKISNEYKELLERFNKLESNINDLKSSKVLDGVNIVNKSLIQPGMIPVAIDNKGNFVALYPFANNITEVNGQHAANGIVVIDATMLKYKAKDISVETALQSQADAIVALKDLLDKISENLKTLAERLNELDYKVEQHINNGII